MRVRKTRSIDAYLKGLADFLNTARPGATEKQWKAFCQRMKGHPMEFYFHSYRLNEASGRFKNQERLSLGEAKDICADIIEDLAYLRHNQSPFPYGNLVVTLNELEFKVHYQCQSTGSRRANQAFLLSHGKKWIVKAQPIAENPRKLLYSILATALVNGTLNRLQICRWCGSYIAIKDRKRRFCPGTSCKDNYFNRERRENRDMIPRWSSVATARNSR